MKNLYCLIWITKELHLAEKTVFPVQSFHPVSQQKLLNLSNAWSIRQETKDTTISKLNRLHTIALKIILILIWKWCKGTHLQYI